MVADTATVRQFMHTRFNDEELRTLSFDYFPEVYDDFTTGMTKGQKVQLLLDYCRRKEQLPVLMAALKRERPEQYPQQFSSPEKTGVTVKQPQPQPPRIPSQIFISHAHEDAEFAQRLANDLEARGLPVWIAPNSIQPGEKWVEAINRGLGESELFVLLVTPPAVESRWVQSETSVAVALEHEGKMQFIPLDIEPANTPPLWRAYQYISFRGGYAAGLNALLTQLESEVHKPAELVKPPEEEKVSGVTIGNIEGGVHDSIISGRDVDININQAFVDEKFYEVKVYEVPSVKNLVQLPTDPDITTIIWEKDGKAMVRIPAGDFLYGDDKESMYLDEFWIDKTPVTNAEYARFIADTGQKPRKHWYGNNPPSKIANHPVTNVSWDDAAAYAEWAGKRLLYEREWEKAARGTDGREYPWGNQEPTAELCNFDGNVGATIPVGRYSPQGDSPYGCVDMAGNVFEWTGSRPDGEKQYRVLRGGSWESDKKWLRCTDRGCYLPDIRNDYIGFRVVVSSLQVR